MKVLIVDDEKHVAEAIRLLIPWEEYGVTEVDTAQDVAQAVRLLDEKRPEIAFVDVVIGDRDGSEILSHINARRYGTKVISVSGHDDYQYVRAMFLLGSIDYLLKPLEPEDVLRSLQKAIALVRSEQPRTEGAFGIDQMGKQLFPDRVHGLLRKLFSEKLRAVAYEELCRVSRNIASASECVILHGDGMLLPLHVSGYPLRLSAFLNELQARLEAANCGTLFQHSSPAPDVIVLLYASLEQGVALVRGALEQLAASGPPLTLGCSARCAFPGAIDAAARQAELAAGAAGFSEHAVIVPYREDMEPLPYPSDYRLENQMLSAFLVGSALQLNEAASAWTAAVAAALPQTAGALHMLRRVYLGFYQKLKFYCPAQEASAVQEAADRSAALASFLAGSWAQTVHNLASFFIERILALQELNKQQPGSRPDTMQLVAAFLESNYSQKITQQDLADLFYLNKDYLCRRFKQEYGVSMMTYLAGIRISKAQELLSGTALHYQQIAEAVGISDSKYFARQFKQKTGMTPAEYRARNGR